MALAQTASEDIGYLVGLIVRDEEHHRELVREMKNAVHGDIEYRAIEPRVPRGTIHAARQTRLLEVTEELLRLEREDLKKLRKFRRALRRQRDGSLFSVIAEQMEFDTRKHIALLERIRGWARNPVKGWATG